MQVQTAAAPNYDYFNHLLAIIDSKIQYIGFGLNQMLETVSNVSSAESTITPHSPASAFPLIEYMTRKKSLLIILRKNIHFDNLPLVYHLLKDDFYAHFSRIKLSEILKENSLKKLLSTPHAISDSQ